MSERGTFTTSYVYDHALRPVLRQYLPKVCRAGCFVDALEGRWFTGLMHGSYGGEEALIMEFFIEDLLLDALPAEHGKFSITVLPEDEAAATVFIIHNRVVIIRKICAG